MSGGGSGGGGSSNSVNTSTTTTDVPEWMRGYMQDVLGRAQTISNQPYNQYPGQQIAGFTPDQQAAFGGIRDLNSTYAPTQQSALNTATAGANTAAGIYGAGAGNINASTGYNPLAAVAPYLGASSGYNSAAAGQPWLQQAAGFQGAAAQAGTPGGIASYMSPYTSNVVQGIQDQANQNWNQNIMPGINDKFVGSGQYGSGRNAQVLGQAAGNFQTGLSANVSNALQSGYSMAGNQAAQQAQLLSGLGSQSLTGAQTASGLETSQVNNLLNQAKTGADATSQQAQNLQSAGTALGNLQATQGQQQLSAGTTLGNLSQQQQQMGLSDAQALQAVGQQQQQLNQSNLDLAKSDYQAQANQPKDMTEWMASIIRGLPTQNQSQTAVQNPAYSVSPLQALGGAGATALTLSGNVGGKKKGGLIKNYANGGAVKDEELSSPLDAVVDNPLKIKKTQIAQNDNSYNDAMADEYFGSDYYGDGSASKDDGTADVPDNQSDAAFPLGKPGAEPQMDLASSDTTADPGASSYAADEPGNKAYNQRNQLLAIARGMLTPTRNGSVAEAFGNSLGNLTDMRLKEEEMGLKREDVGIRRQAVEQGKYTPIKDMFGNVTGAINTKTGELVQVGGMPGGVNATAGGADEPPSADPQKAGMQILEETGTPFTPIGSRQDITGRNAQAKAYRDAAVGAKSAIQQLNLLNAETGKYTPGGLARRAYNAESYLGRGGAGASARAEADKSAKALANAFMAQNVGAKGAGIRMVEFDAGAVPNADMPDEARSELITKNKAIANSQIQRAAISDMYPRMHLSNVNAIMDAYEAKNPPVLENGKANPKWMTYKDWLAKGRPNTAALALDGADKGTGEKGAAANPGQPTLADLIAEKNRRKQAQ